MLFDLEVGEDAYLEGLALHLKHNVVGALPHYHRSADQGFPAAISLGVEDDEEKADYFLSKISDRCEWFKNRVETQNKPDMLFNFARCYDIGVFSNGWPDQELAAQYYLKSANQGFMLAQNSIGYSYTYGEGVDPDFGLAFEFYQKSADQGFANGECSVGSCYSTGEGVVPCEKKAVEYYRRSADQGYFVAQTNLAHCYMIGQGVEKNQEEGLRYFKLAAAQGDCDALGLLGDWYLKKDVDQAIIFYERAARKKNFECARKLGRIYEGRETESGYLMAIDWFKIASDDSSIVFCFKSLGEMFEDGDRKDLKKSLRFYQYAVDWGWVEEDKGVIERKVGSYLDFSRTRCERREVVDICMIILLNKPSALFPDLWRVITTSFLLHEIFKIKWTNEG